VFKIAAAKSGDSILLVYRAREKQAKAYQGQGYTKSIFESRNRLKVVKIGKK
jgi:hypothetical protein